MIDINTVAAVATAFIAGFGLAWTIWRHRTESQPTLKGKIEYGRGADDAGRLTVRIWNAGNKPVYITGVALQYRDAGDV